MLAPSDIYFLSVVNREKYAVYLCPTHGLYMSVKTREGRIRPCRTYGCEYRADREYKEE